MAKRRGWGGRLVVLLTLTGLFLFLIFRVLGSGGGPEKAVTITIPSGSSLNSAARRLEKAGAIKFAEGFLAYAKIFGGSAPILAGQYSIPAHASAADILELLQSGKTIRQLITIPEGMPSILVYERLNAEPRLTGKIAVPKEGSILPETYDFETGDTRASVIERMQKAMQAEIETAWKARKPSTAVKSTKDAIILASIVEKETSKVDEYRKVAAVYSNRLRLGMRLQADPTVIYPVSKGKPIGRRIRRSELRDVNPYNTYAIEGLPAGPIANPSRAAIAAVLDPAPIKSLFFVADGSGGHVFAQTLEQHNANVRKWYAIRRERGEM